MKEYNLIIIGGGLSGMTAALSAMEEDTSNVLIIERESNLGGLLNRFICNGFGKKLLNVDLTGPEYINFIENKLRSYPVEIKLNTEVLEVSEERVITYVNSYEGVTKVKGNAVILATGCREKLTGSLTIPINNIAGIYTVGNVQKIINLEGYLPGREPVVIAENRWAFMSTRRMIIEGAKIKAFIINTQNGFEVNDEIMRLIEGFNIPIMYNCEIEGVYGENRVEGVKIYSQENDAHTLIACDSLVLSVGYFPEVRIVNKTSMKMNEKTLAPVVNNYETSVNGIFACGNLVYGLDAVLNTDINGGEVGNIVSKYLKSNFETI
ncbi:MAG: FAD-dependent oxidoreductase [Clostridium sp.]|nr:FAD-dependent oxidoreductase [Clostridium sp.]